MNKVNAHMHAEGTLLAAAPSAGQLEHVFSQEKIQADTKVKTHLSQNTPWYCLLIKGGFFWHTFCNCPPQFCVFV